MTSGISLESGVSLGVFKIPLPVSVSYGGTGLTTITTDAVIVGNGTSAMGVTPVTINETTGAIAGFKATLNNQTGTTYTLDASDTGKTVTFNNASAITVTLPNSFDIGFTCECIQLGAGAVTFTPASGASRQNRQSHTKTAGQYAAARLVVTANSGGSAAVYNLAGDTA